MRRALTISITCILILVFSFGILGISVNDDVVSEFTKVHFISVQGQSRMVWSCTRNLRAVGKHEYSY